MPLDSNAIGLLLLWLIAPPGDVASVLSRPPDPCQTRIASYPSELIARCAADHGLAAARAAQEYGLPDWPTLLGIALVESGCSSAEWGGAGQIHYGATQVNTLLHMRLLIGGGIRPWSWDLDESLRAAAVVLSWIRTLWPELSESTTLCIYGSGERGRWWRSCEYSRCVNTATRRVRAELW